MFVENSDLTQVGDLDILRKIIYLDNVYGIHIYIIIYNVYIYMYYFVLSLFSTLDMLYIFCYRASVLGTCMYK